MWRCISPAAGKGAGIRLIASPFPWVRLARLRQSIDDATQCVKLIFDAVTSGIDRHSGAVDLGIRDVFLASSNGNSWPTCRRRGG